MGAHILLVGEDNFEICKQRGVYGMSCQQLSGTKLKLLLVFLLSSKVI